MAALTIDAQRRTPSTLRRSRRQQTWSLPTTMSARPSQRTSGPLPPTHATCPLASASHVLWNDPARGRSLPYCCRQLSRRSHSAARARARPTALVLLGPPRARARRARVVRLAADQPRPPSPAPSGDTAVTAARETYERPSSRLKTHPARGALPTEPKPLSGRSRCGTCAVRCRSA